MSLGFRIAGAGAMAVTAMLCASAALGDIKPTDTAPPRVTVEPTQRVDSASEFFLRESSGFVAVFDTAASALPVSVTDIEVESLRYADRVLLEEGIAVRDREELLSLLEDLGS